MKYAIKEEIGRGGMGVVWRAEGPDGVVALKVIQSAAGSMDEEVSREIQAMARLTHPNVVTVFDHGRLPEGPFVAMPLAEATLADELERGWLQTFEQVREVLNDVLAGLAHAHARGVLHRDVKPENVLGFRTEDDRRWVLSDFGLAHQFGNHTAGAQPTGTPAFMPPEQFVGRTREFGPWTDLYALGCLAHYLVAGRPPFPGKTFLQLAMQHANEPPRRLEPLLDVPPGFQEWVDRLLEKSPGDRFAFASDARVALKGLPSVESRDAR